MTAFAVAVESFCVEVALSLIHSGFIQPLHNSSQFSESSLYTFSAQFRPKPYVALATVSSLFSTSTLDIFSSQSSEIWALSNERNKNAPLLLQESSSSLEKKGNIGDVSWEDSSSSGNTKLPSAKRRSSATHAIPSSSVHLLLGEEALLSESNVLLSYDDNFEMAEYGSLVITNFRVVLCPEVQFVQSVLCWSTKIESPKGKLVHINRSRIDLQSSNGPISYDT